MALVKPPWNSPAPGFSLSHAPDRVRRGRPLFVFEPDGTLAASHLASEVHGPFGIVVAGAVPPCGAFKP
jgi:hypothetical protein